MREFDLMDYRDIEDLLHLEKRRPGSVMRQDPLIEVRGWGCTTPLDLRVFDALAALDIGEKMRLSKAAAAIAEEFGNEVEAAKWLLDNAIEGTLIEVVEN